MNPSIQLSCQHCGTVLRIASAMAGKQGKCPKCKQVITMKPSAVASASVAVDAPPPPPSPAAEAALAERMQRILAAFRGPIEPVKRPGSYRTGVTLAAVVMLILPLLYVLLVAAIIGLLAAHAMYDTWIFQINIRGRGAILLLLAYAGPIVAGALVVLFMLKPLFARFPNKQATRSLSRDQEPLLFAFVDKVCDAVHAPRPKRIDVDCDVNASASFRRGVLSFIGHDLVLTIGLPLTAGLSLTEFGGVLAHEFGHFSQGAGMRLSYVVRVISAWFARVVYERDNWDLWLESTARSVDIRIGFVLYLAMAGVWLSRRVLSVLMYIGFFVSGILLREMEFDADRHEARFGGSEAFARTSRKLPILGIAFQKSLGDAYRFYQEDRLADNLPKLMLANLKQLPEATKRKINEEAEKRDTGRFDTHPCDRERIASAKKENAPGVFALDEPASVLFSDFDALSRLSSVDYYTDVIGVKIRNGLLHPVEQLLSGHEKEQDAEKALNRIIGSLIDNRLVVVPSLTPQVSLAEQTAFLQQAREYLKSTRTDYFAAQLTYNTFRRQYYETESRYSLVRAGAAPSLLKGDGPKNLSAAGAKRRDDELQMGTFNGLLAPYETCAGQRIAAALSILASGALAENTHPFHESRPHIARWHAAKRELDAMAGDRTKLEMAIIRFASQLGGLESSSERTGYVDSVLETSKEVAGLVNDFRRRTTNLLYPLEHRDPKMTVARFFSPEPLLAPENIGEVYQVAATTLEKYDDLSRRLTGRLALICEQVESALGMPPLAEPPPPPEEPAAGGH